MTQMDKIVRAQVDGAGWWRIVKTTSEARGTAIFSVFPILEMGKDREFKTATFGLSSSALTGERSACGSFHWHEDAQGAIATWSVQSFGAYHQSDDSFPPRLHSVLECDSSARKPYACSSPRRPRRCCSSSWQATKIGIKEGERHLIT